MNPCAWHRHPGATPRGRERGAGTVLVAVTCWVVLGCTVLGLWLAGWVGCRHRAAHAADLGALAGAQAHVRGQDACQTARRRVQDNGATPVTCRVEGNQRDFLVRVTAQTDLVPVIGGHARVVQVDAVAGSLPSR